MAKLKTSMTLSERAKQLLVLLAADIGIPQSGVIEVAIREMAARRGVK